MKQLLLCLTFSLALAISFTIPQVGPGGAATTLAAHPRISQDIPQNASRSRRGYWICDGGYVKRDETCVTVDEATDTEVRQQMIATSVEGYSGSCPCPYFRDRAGRSCGRRSAYSRPGGASPLCYERDITDEAVEEYRARYPSHH